jgi:hypothetical protein
MDLPTIQLNVLKVLCDTHGDRGDFVSIERLIDELDAKRSGQLPQVGSSLRSLRRQHYVVFRDGDAVKITETGIAALKSL